MRWVLEKAWRRGYRQVSVLLEDMPIFYVWAGEVMARDLAYRVDQPEAWFQEHHLAAIRAWTNQRKRRAGLPA